jgi:hypothetical protein
MKVQKGETECGGALWTAKKYTSSFPSSFSSSSSSSYTPLQKTKEMDSECRHEHIKDMFIAQDEKDLCAFIKAHILKRTLYRDFIKTFSLWGLYKRNSLGR